MEKTTLPIKIETSKAPLRILLYGQEGVGKTLWANQKDTLFLTSEDGSGDMECASISCETWPELRDHTRAILATGVPYRKLAVDTISSFEKLCSAWVTESAGVDSIEKVGDGFGKGNVRIVEEMAAFQADLDRIRKKWSIHIIVLGHAHATTFNDPAGPAYHKYELMMNAKAAAVWTRWADCQLFACFDATVAGGKRKKELEDVMAKGKVIGMDRVLYTTKGLAYDAKNRHNLPEELPLSWDAFAKAIRWTQRERAFNPLCCLQDAFVARVLEVAPGASPAQIQAAEALLMKGKSFSVLTAQALCDARKKIEAMPVEDLAKIVGPALEATTPAAGAASAITAAPVVDPAEEAEAEQHAAYEAVKAAFVRRCTKINEEAPGDSSVAVAELEPKLGGPWASNSAATNNMLIGKWAAMSDETFGAMISPFVIKLGF